MIGNFPTMTRLWHAASERLLYAGWDQLDRITGLTTLVYDNFLAAKSMEFDFDVGRDLWLTDKRFPKLQRDYLDFAELAGFFDRCEAIANDAARRGVITQMHCRPARRRDGSSQHVWGNCMLAFTYHGGKRWNQPTLGLHSRVSYIAYLGAMDMGLAWVIAREIARRTGIEVEEMAFRWHVDSLQWHGMKSIPYVISHGHHDEVMNAEKYPKRDYPTVGITRRVVNGLDHNMNAGKGTDKETMKFGPARRMNVRYQRVMSGGSMPSVPLGTLELLCP